MVIDDDVATRTIVTFSLTAFGYRVLAAGEGDAALEIARDHPEIRLIMMDVMMPGLSGKVLAEQLKASLPESSVLYCSGHPYTSMSSHDIDVAVEHFLQKPYRPPELKQKLEQMLMSRQAS